MISRLLRALVKGLAEARKEYTRLTDAARKEKAERCIEAVNRRDAERLVERLATWL